MLQLSHLKLIAGVVFALFVLTACGGGGDAAAPAAATNNTDAGTGDSAGGAVTEATCEADGKYWTGTACVAKITDASCTNHTDSPYNNVNPATNTCHDPYSPKDLAYFDDTTDDTDEYSTSKALAGVNAAQAYVKIEALIDADYGAGNITQGGAGQIISIASDKGFNTTHQEFGTNGAAFNSIYDTSGAGTQHTDNGITASGFGKCAIADCNGTQYAALIAGRKADDTMHGIAYNAKLQGIVANNSTGQLTKALTQGVKNNAVAMHHVWEDETVQACTYNNGDYQPDLGIVYNRPKGKDINSCNDSGGNKVVGDANLVVAAGNRAASAGSNEADSTVTELSEWTTAVSASNKTIMVFGAGDLGFNSEIGKLATAYATGDLAALGSAVANVNTLQAFNSNVADANIPNFRAAYPALDNSLNVGKWLTVTALDSSDTILESANGCGIAMSFCLSAPGATVHSAGKSGANAAQNSAYADVSSTKAASSTVAGSLAVLKGAFPNATPEQLTRLVLQTSTYIELDGKTSCSSGTDCVAGLKDFVDPDGGTENDTEDEQYRMLVCKSDADSSIVEVVTTCSADFTHADHPTSGGKLYVNPVYGYGKLDMAAATTPSITLSSLSIGNNESIGVLWKDTQLTLSSHFGTGLDSVSLGIGDEYGRHFTVKANKITSAPVAVASLDEYMGNMLADNVQSQTLGGQAKLNYSNTAQPWMNLEYKAGKATSKIAFQDNYKISPLNDNATTSILRANHIRPASNNIGMMDVDYALNGALSLSSYAARGEYDTGYKFDELGTDFDVNYKKSHLNIAIGNIREHDQFLGTHTTGGYALNAPTVSRFTDVTYGHDLGKTDRFNIYANYINYETDVDMLHDQFASIDNLQADQYQVGFTGKNLMSDDDNLNVALITKLGVTDGALNQNTTLGYTADGAFNDVSQSYDLAVSERHQQFEITYQGKIYQNSDKVSTLKDNRFFTTIRVDQNLNHVQGASQTEIVTGMQARF